MLGAHRQLRGLLFKAPKVGWETWLLCQLFITGKIGGHLHPKKASLVNVTFSFFGHRQDAVVGTPATEKEAGEKGSV